MQLEIGGGVSPRQYYTNLDQCPTADIRHDLNVLPWPVRDDCAKAIYSSHCLEHLVDPHTALMEICRIGQLGCQIEIRVPDGDVAMIPGHTCHLSETWWRNLYEFLPLSFPHPKRTIRIDGITRVPNHMHYPAIATAFPTLSEQQILLCFPRASFELVVRGTIISRKQRWLEET